MASRVMDGNEAVASVAYRLNEVIAIYPITPASPMAEHCDHWAAGARENLWACRPSVVEMQSEGGAAGAVHGALQAGALATTFTSSQGLLLMLPNMYKIAGELLPCVLHVAARTVATHALSIFCDHSDVMACRQTGFALLGSSSVQQAHDFACIAQLSTLRSRVPFLHFFDGFRTSHELVRVDELSDETLRTLFDETLLAEHRRRALSPDSPSVRGTAQNPDTFFQAREACNPFYDRLSGVVLDEMARFAAATGRRYDLFDYQGHPEPERVIVIMGSAATTAGETARVLAARGERVGVLHVLLFRPFDVARFSAKLPRSTRRIAVLDRTKEPGAVGEPLYAEVIAALAETGRSDVLVSGGRYGLSSKEFTPAMVAAVFRELARETPRRHFTVGIRDDVTALSLELAPAEPSLLEPSRPYEAMFFGLGSDGTVGANKNTIKILGELTELAVQGYFVYDSKKSGAVTVSHLRFGREPFSRPYLIEQADFVGCHQWEFLDRYPILERVRPGATLLLNSPHGKRDTFARLPRQVQERILDQRIRVYVIDAYRVAGEAGLGRRINTVMQVCFFALSRVVPLERAIAEVKRAIEHSYAKKGSDVVARNLRAVDTALDHLEELSPPAELDPAPLPKHVDVFAGASEFVRRVTAAMIAGAGDTLPVSAFPVDGTWPSGTSRWEKRGLAAEIPVWDAKLCIQCNKCAIVCPHAAIRAKVYPSEELLSAPAGLKSSVWKAKDFAGSAYTIQVAPEDCTGCGLCVEVCPAKDRLNPDHKALEMQADPALRQAEQPLFEFFRALPEVDRRRVHLDVKGSQLLEPLFEFSGACAGCGETPYIKLLTQLFGDRLVVANATGCSSIYGGNLPTTPYTVDRNGRGPAWANSLFEDNAEFGFGMRHAIDAHAAEARNLLLTLAARLSGDLVDGLLRCAAKSEVEITEQRSRVAALRTELGRIDQCEARRLEQLADYLVRKSVWMVGGDGWAYDIGFGGLDHVLASQRDVNVLVLDTEVYSNTGGQQSKATPLGASAKFAELGKEVPKKDLGILAMSYGHVYVARVALGAKEAHTVRAFLEAEAYPGPSLIIAYSPCIAHGYELVQGLKQQQLAVESGVWPLFRFDPRRAAAGAAPLVLDSAPGKATVREYLRGEPRFSTGGASGDAGDEQSFARIEAAVRRRVALYEQLAKIVLPGAAASHDAAE